MLQSLSDRHERLCQFLRGLRHPVAIAFSGGVDSTFLLACAVSQCQYPTYALHASSPFVHKEDRLRIKALAIKIGVSLLSVEWNPFEHEEIVRNSKRRCYFCKSSMYRHLLDHAASLGSSILMDGTQADDMVSDRPGLQAISELGIITPLAQFGLDKQDIRHLSYLQTLETWELASQSCLATRIETGRRITYEELLLIDKIEHMLSRKGVRGSRFRIGNGKVRLVLPGCSRTQIRALLNSTRAMMAESGFDSLDVVPEI